MAKRKRTAAKYKRLVVWPIFSQYTRLRDCLRTTGTIYIGACISCGREFDIGRLQAGHFIPGRHNSNLFYERGCHAQCERCNAFLAGNQYSYGQALIKLYGKGIIEELWANERIIKKFRRDELVLLAQELREKIKKLL